jgi:hypothetical protein
MLLISQFSFNIEKNPDLFPEHNTSAHKKTMFCGSP